MNRLILMRHGEAERDSANGDDFERPLSTAGLKEAQSTAEALKELGLMPELALVSGAVRTRQTWAVASSVFAAAGEIIQDALYLAEPKTIHKLVADAAGLADTLIVVGHNPGLQELAVSLLVQATSPSGAIQKVRAGLPTGAAVVFLFDANGRPAYDGVFFPRDRR